MAQPRRVLPSNMRNNIVADQRLPLAECTGMTVKQIRKTKQYRGLTPLGKINVSGSYRYGFKSYMRKDELCEALSNPKLYHEKIAKLKRQKRNAGPRQRTTRRGLCLVKARKPPCNTSAYSFQGYTTTGLNCCYKRKMSAKTMAKRLARRNY